MNKFLDYVGLGQYTSILKNYIGNKLNALGSRLDDAVTDAKDTANKAATNASQAITIASDIADQYPLKIESTAEGYVFKQGSDAGDWVTIGTISTAGTIRSVSVVTGKWAEGSFTEGAEGGTDKALKIIFQGNSTPYYQDITDGFSMGKAGEGILINDNVVSVKFGDGQTDVADGYRLKQCYDKLFPVLSSLSANISPSTFEYGKQTKVSVGWMLKYKNADNTTPDEISIYDRTTQQTTDLTGKQSYSIDLTDGRSFLLTVKKNGETFTQSVGCSAIDRWFMGFSDKAVLPGDDAPALSPGVSGYSGGYLNRNVSGEYSLNGSGYFYIVVPSSLAVSKLTSGGFDVPFQTQATDVTITGKKEKYTIYRTDNQVKCVGDKYKIN